MAETLFFAGMLIGVAVGCGGVLASLIAAVEIREWRERLRHRAALRRTAGGGR